MTKEQFENAKLDAEEMQYEADSALFVPVENQPAEREKMMRAAALYENRENKKSVTLRVSAADIAALKEEAVSSGLPYQTLVSSILHRYVSGNLIDQAQVKKILSSVR